MERNDDKGRPPVPLSADDNLADLIARIAPEDRALYDSLRHVYTEAGFFNRRFVIVKTMGKDPAGHPRQPDILGAVRLLAFTCNNERGSEITVMDESSSRTLQVGHVPVKLFRFPVFLSVPIYQGVKWEAKELGDGSYGRRLVFGVCFKQMSAIKFYNKDAVAALTPNEYKKHFGDTLPRF